MDTILDRIVASKKKEVTINKKSNPLRSLEKTTFFQRDCVSMKTYLRNASLSGIIAEIKRKSPSKGTINSNFSVEEVSTGYIKSGASGLSVLTDSNFFGGSNEDFITARNLNNCPILRKDFIVDAYQIFESKSIGADVILLIASCLSPKEIRSFASCAKSLGMEVLLEVHNEEELNNCLNEHLDLVGVNNRDLKTFITHIGTSYKLAEKIPNDFLKISESGLQLPETVNQLKRSGFEGFLMGEHFMKSKKPQKACLDFVNQLKKLEKTEGI